MILPLTKYLESHGVKIEYGVDLKNVTFESEQNKKVATQIVYENNGEEKTIDLIKDDVDNILKKKDECERWEDKFLLIFEIMKDGKVFVKNIYHSVSSEILRNNLYRLVYPIIYDEIVEKSKGRNMREEDKKFIIDFYKYAFISIVINLIDNGMNENPEEIVSKVSDPVTGTINHACLSINKETHIEF